MLFMAWGGESTSRLKHAPALWREISRSKNEIRALGVVHQDLRPDNILWNSELGRALIIDFHRSTLDLRPAGKRVTGIKRSLFSSEARDSKRLRVQ
jgi:serine/threonine protein kinase